jgi:galactose-1-phosphate uridylyltransferase
MKKPSKETVTETLDLSRYQIARLSEHAAALLAQLGQVVSLEEYLLMLFDAALEG